MSETTEVKKQKRVTKAEWVISPDGYYPYCSNCCYEPPWVSNTDMRTPFCPNCGCRMSKEDTHEQIRIKW